MKSFKLLFTICFIFILNVEAKKIPGIIITETDTFEVVLKVPIDFFSGKPNYPKVQNKLSYITPRGMLTDVYPENLKEVQLTYLHKTYRFISCLKGDFSDSPIGKNKNIFVRLICDGELKLFNYYATNLGVGYDAMPTLQYYKKDVLQKGDSRYTISSLNFEITMSKFLSNCPELLKKIQRKVLKSRNIITIVNEYNKNCGS